MSRETLEIQVPFFARLLILALRFLNSILKLRSRDRSDSLVSRGEKTLLEISLLSKALGAFG